MVDFHFDLAHRQVNKTCGQLREHPEQIVVVNDLFFERYQYSGVAHYRNYAVVAHGRKAGLHVAQRVFHSKIKLHLYGFLFLQTLTYGEQYVAGRIRFENFIEQLTVLWLKTCVRIKLLIDKTVEIAAFAVVNKNHVGHGSENSLKPFAGFEEQMLGLFLLSDVDEHTQRSEQFSFRRKQGRGRNGEVPHAAIVMPHAGFVAIDIAILTLDGFLLKDFKGFGRSEVRHRFSSKFISGVSQHLGQGVVGKHHTLFKVENTDSGVGIFGHGPVARFAFEQGLHGFVVSCCVNKGQLKEVAANQ